MKKLIAICTMLTSAFVLAESAAPAAENKGPEKRPACKTCTCNCSLKAEGKRAPRGPRFNKDGQKRHRGDGQFAPKKADQKEKCERRPRKAPCCDKVAPKNAEQNKECVRKPRPPKCENAAPKCPEQKKDCTRKPPLAPKCEFIPPRAAIRAALKHANLKKEEVRKVECELDKENGVAVYEVDFKSGKFEYDYEIDAKTGAVLKSKRELD